MLTVSSIVARLARLNARAEEFASEANRMKNLETPLTRLEYHLYVGAMLDAAARLWDARAVLEKALERIARDDAIREVRQRRVRDD